MTQNSLVFIVDDDPSTRALMTHWIETDAYQIRAFETGEQCLEALHEGPDVVCLDILMPGLDGLEVLKQIQSKDPELPVIMVTGEDSLETAVESMKLGAYDFITKPIDRNRLSASLKKAVEKYTLAKKICRLSRALEETYSFHNIIGASPPMKTVFEQMEKVLNNNINLFIQGESGTGKELVARAVHYQGSRKYGPFEAINCGAIPENLLESEFFGYEKGAFTGAVRSQAGKIEMAQGGTLFLDEVGEMSPSLQVKLLRFLETRCFERVGGRKRIEVDVRIISATNKRLREEVENGDFREDLYYRLVVFPIHIPPLRERMEDIPALVKHFLNKYREEAGRDLQTVDHTVMEALMMYDWHGNVRELENVIQRAMVTSENKILQRPSLPSEILEKVTRVPLSTPIDEKTGTEADLIASEIVPMDILEKKAMLNALKITNGNLALAAKKLDISRATFYRKVEKYGLRELSPYLT